MQWETFADSKNPRKGKMQMAKMPLAHNESYPENRQNAFCP